MCHSVSCVHGVLLYILFLCFIAIACARRAAHLGLGHSTATYTHIHIPHNNNKSALRCGVKESGKCDEDLLLERE